MTPYLLPKDLFQFMIVFLGHYVGENEHMRQYLLGFENLKEEIKNMYPVPELFAFATRLNTTGFFKFCIETDLLPIKDTPGMQESLLFVKEFSGLSTNELDRRRLLKDDNRILLVFEFACLYDIPILLKNCSSLLKARDREKQTALHIAAKRGSVDSLIILLTRNTFQVDAVDANGNYPLHLAAANGHSKITTLLIGAGALVNVINKAKESPIFVAAKHGHMKVLKHLIAGPDGGSSEPLIIESIKCMEEDDALKAIKTLVHCGWDINEKDTNGKGLLYHAVRLKKIKLLPMLLDEGAVLDDGGTVLDFKFSAPSFPDKDKIWRARFKEGLKMEHYFMTKFGGNYGSRRRPRSARQQYDYEKIQMGHYQ